MVEPIVDPIALYGDELAFEVRRNGTPVGEHRVTFRRDGDDLHVNAVFAIEIRFLTFTAYRYRYESNSVWRGNCLVALQADVDDDGELSGVRARQEDDGLRISGPEGEVTAPLGLFPTDHWHAGVLLTNRVLNTLTGRLNSVRIEDRGVVEIPFDEGSAPVRHYAYTGELNTEVWYDAAGRWVGMRFAGKDGSTIEHRCRSCALSQAAGR